MEKRDSVASLRWRLLLLLLLLMKPPIHQGRALRHIDPIQVQEWDRMLSLRVLKLISSWPCLSPLLSALGGSLTPDGQPDPPHTCCLRVGYPSFLQGFPWLCENAFWKIPCAAAVEKISVFWKRAGDRNKVHPFPSGV